MHLFITKYLFKQKLIPIVQSLIGIRLIEYFVGLFGFKGFLLLFGMWNIKVFSFITQQVKLKEIQLYFINLKLRHSINCFFQIIIG